MQILINNVLFGLVLSLAAFEVGIFINRNTRIPILNPLLIAIGIIICFLFAFHIDFDTYNKGGQFINMFLGPSTVVLAVPLYKQLDLLKKNAKAILTGIFVGSAIGIISIIGISYLVGLNASVIKSLVPKSVTTPIGISISSQLGGVVPITVLAIIITGIVGAVFGPTICKIFRIKDKVAVGVSIGTASHAVGTSKALELGEVEGAMSSLSIGIAGIMTVIIAPLVYNLALYMYHIIK
ncbi:LrgB family protein [Clostridium beijerinckii]|jgi:predicted murein hydrolase (TIGR00659 family)|uniref:LrgB family protein n=2 Tax=Clostridium beijerinckii TaxID=1520 RepID=A0AAE2RMF6_CLOBE|nr:LrgB family protein [Clostridium beijerinckii]ABR33121.1 LrgB family protein [Clostridium beijerinckii NCIMB 8052]AIU02722.1 LrgB family protein [Clostridium beijerinckii ATCC 35702]MBF7807199.1 LrgB family protein [Clostridium beijerinckii]NOW93066.1 putative murein hydrolase (TIGR00659 family) [Clostridium beijerinckii]NRT25632.1 putative murein hydrolase (TIGR00659 family) [Clostridium beijerinckii]